MNIDFINHVAEATEIERRDLIEKDILLHGLLLDLSQNNFVHPNFLFKGGTCLIKGALGYYRFSEDMDFTWADQNRFEHLSQKQIRRELSGLIDETGAIFEDIARKRGLHFECDKNDTEYVEIGGSNKMVTFKLWFLSEVLKRRSFLKVQINFVEKLSFQPVKSTLTSLLNQPNHETRLLFPEDYKEYRSHINLNTYDLREILCEKVRSILTRKDPKARDFVDIYQIYKETDMVPQDVREAIIAKTVFALKLYTKYKDNFMKNREMFAEGEAFTWGGERDLLLSSINETEFYSFLNDLSNRLQDIITDIETRSV